MDLTLFLWINGWGGTIGWVDRLSLYIIGDYFIPVLLSTVLFGVWFVDSEVKRPQKNQLCVLASLLGVGISNSFNSALNQIVSRARPFVDYDTVLLFYPPTDSSFPANPAVVGFALAIGILFANRWLGYLAVVLALMWGLSRVYSGVNYPLDVLAGYFLGGGSTTIIYIGFHFSPIGQIILRKLPNWASPT